MRLLRHQEARGKSSNDEDAVGVVVFWTLTWESRITPAHGFFITICMN